MVTSQVFYNKFANSYAQYAVHRDSYLRAVDDFIKAESVFPKKIIDIGTGDGKRALRIANSKEGNDLTLIDNSEKMIALARKIKKAKIISADIADDEFILNKKYEIVLCLWNVMGHVPSAKKRARAFKNLAKLLVDDGVLFIDVNNRYNAVQYGILAIIKNIFKDICFPKETNGDFIIKLKTRTGCIQTISHIFSPCEVESLIKQSGLKILKRRVLNYKTGRKCRSIFCGQLVYKLTKL